MLKRSWIVIAILALMGCSTTRYDEVDYGGLLEFARLASLSYGSHALIQEELKSLGEVTILEFEENQGRVVLVQNHSRKLQFLIFRGTDNATNWLYNLKSVNAQHNTLPIITTVGFSQYAKVFKDGLWTGENLKPGYSTILIGHSLGGVTANLIGAELAQQGYKIDWVVTFGAPKFTDVQGGIALSQLPVIRVLLDDDDVTELFPSYQHFGVEVRLFRDGFTSISYQKEKKGASGRGTEIDEHSIKEYVYYLWARAEMQKAMIVKRSNGYAISGGYATGWKFLLP